MCFVVENVSTPLMTWSHMTPPSSPITPRDDARCVGHVSSHPLMSVAMSGPRLQWPGRVSRDEWDTSPIYPPVDARGVGHVSNIPFADIRLVSPLSPISLRGYPSGEALVANLPIGWYESWRSESTLSVHAYFGEDIHPRRFHFSIFSKHTRKTSPFKYDFNRFCIISLNDK